MSPPEPELVLLTAGLVAALRQRWPALDGRAVYLAALGVAAIVACASTPSGTVRDLVIHTLKLWLGAVAAASGAGYVAGKAAAPPPEGHP